MIRRARACLPAVALFSPCVFPQWSLRCALANACLRACCSSRVRPFTILDLGMQRSRVPTVCSSASGTPSFRSAFFDLDACARPARLSVSMPTEPR